MNGPAFSHFRTQRAQQPNPRLYVYAVGPIDRGWQQLPTIDEYLAKTGEDLDHIGFARFVADAFDAASRHSIPWEGDFKLYALPRVIVLPDSDDATAYALMWKQANNGTTFVVSQLPLSWLRDCG